MSWAPLLQENLSLEAKAIASRERFVSRALTRYAWFQIQLAVPWNTPFMKSSEHVRASHSISSQKPQINSKHNATPVQRLWRAAMYIFGKTPQAASMPAAAENKVHAVRFGALRWPEHKTELQSLDGPAAACFLAKKMQLIIPNTT